MLILKGLFCIRAVRLSRLSVDGQDVEPRRRINEECTYYQYYHKNNCLSKGKTLPMVDIGGAGSNDQRRDDGKVEGKSQNPNPLIDQNPKGCGTQENPQCAKGVLTGLPLLVVSEIWGRWHRGRSVPLADSDA